MARINIDIGALGNPATGDTLRTAFTKINNNFAEVYSLVQDGSSGLIATDVTNGDLKLQANGTGSIEIDNLSITGDTITTIATNGSVDINGNGTGGVNIEALHFNGTSINSADSSRINLNESVTVDGDLVVTGSIAGTFTVSSLDADSSTVSNLEVDNFKASAIVIESEGIGSNDNDTTIPTSAAVKDYVDTNAGTGSFTFSGNTISGPSNADVEITPGGTGNVNLNGDTVRVGDNNTDATVTTQGTGDLTLSTNGGTNSGTIKIADGANGDITLDTDGTGDVLLKGDKVGIGTVNQPDTTLHLKDSNAVITLQRTADANTPGLSFQNSNGNVRGVIKLDGTSGTSNEIFMQTYDGSSQAERFRVTHTGAKVSGTLNVDDGISITDNTITSSASNADLEINASGTGTVVLENLKVGTGATVTTILDEDNMASNSATALSTQQSIKAYVDTQVATVPTGDITSVVAGTGLTGGGTTGDVTLNVIGGTGIDANANDIAIDATVATLADTQTLTNKTLTSPKLNEDVAITSTATELNLLDGITGIADEDNMSSNSATQLATQQSIKAYVDAEISGVSTGSTGDLTISGSTISAPSNADLTLNAGGTGSVDIDGIQIKGTTLSSTDSTQININENVSIDGTLTVSGSPLSGALNTAGNTGTGTVALASESLQVLGTTNEINVDAAAFALSLSLADNISGIVSVTASSFLANDAIKIVDNHITGTRSNEDIVLKPNGTGQVVLNQIKSDDSSMIVVNDGLNINGNLQLGDNNTLSIGDGNDLLIYHNGGSSVIRDAGTGSLILQTADDQRVTDLAGTTFSAKFTPTGAAELYHNGTKRFETTASGIYVPDVTQLDRVVITDNEITTNATNTPLELNPNGTGNIIAQRPLLFNAGYIEKINTLTSSSTITVDCSAASIHKVTLGTSTEFNISNLPTGGTVTLIITQDGSGSRTATFGTDGSTAVKFPGGAPTLSTGAGDIDVVTIINDGTNFLGNCAKDYS